MRDSHTHIQNSIEYDHEIYFDHSFISRRIILKYEEITQNSKEFIHNFFAKQASKNEDENSKLLLRFVYGLCVRLFYFNFEKKIK